MYDLKTQKIEGVVGSGDKDVYQVNWLNDNRLVYSLSARKLYGLGLMAGDVGSISDSYALLQYYGSSLIAVPPKNRLRPWCGTVMTASRFIGISGWRRSIPTSNPER